MYKKLISIVVLMWMSFAANADDYQAGVHYRVLDTPIASSNEVVVVNEFFGYTCPHCNAFHPLLEHWADKQDDSVVVFAPVPVVFSRAWEPYAKAYYIANILKVADRTHDAMYNAIHIDKRRMASKPALQKFFAEYGVSEADFDKAYDSFGLKNLLRQGKRLATKSGITGVPSMMVDGKYVVDTAMAGSHANMLKVVDYLVAKESN